MSSSSGNSSRTIAVVGGGITGLSAAFRLTQQGHRVRLFEASGRLGGVVRTERTDGWLIENGPNSFQENSPQITALISELGLNDQRVLPAPAAKKRYIVRGGKLHALPSSPIGLLRTSLFSVKSKRRLLKELFTRPRKRSKDVSLAELVEEHFGREIVDYALNPFVSGVYAGDPEKLSARYAFPSLWESESSHGSVIRGLLGQAKARRRRGESRPRIISFQNGLQTFTDALASRLSPGSVQLNSAVERIIPGANWTLTWRPRGDDYNEEFSAVILALPANALAALPLASTGMQPLAPLAKVVSPPVASLFLGFRRDQVAHPLDGFGALVPAAENRKLLGVLFSSSLFMHRAPEGHVALTVLIGGALRPELTAFGEEDLIRETMPEVSSLLGVKGNPVFSRLTLWPTAIPQYNLGREHVLEAISSCEAASPGLYIGGQIRDGIALPACVQAGLRLAERAAG